MWPEGGVLPGGFCAFDPANMPSMDFRALRAGSCERRVEICNCFSPCGPAKRWISQPLARGWEAAHACDGRRNWFEAVRRTNSGIAPAAPRACWPAPSAAPEFVEVELEPAPPHARPSGAVAVDLRTMTALVGPGADEGAR